eukprot:Rmarinus@m.28402
MEDIPSRAIHFTRNDIETAESTLAALKKRGYQGTPAYGTLQKLCTSQKEKFALSLRRHSSSSRPSDPTVEYTLTPFQVCRLRAQILALKMVSRGVALSPSFRAAITAGCALPWSENDPYPVESPMTPSVMSMIRQFESNLQKRLGYRMQELEDVENQVTSGISPEVRQQIALEQRMLRLRDLQRACRLQIIKNIRKVMPNTHYVDSSRYELPMPIEVLEPAVKDRVAGVRRQKSAERKVQMQRDFTNGIVTWSTSLLEEANSRSLSRKRINKIVSRWHQTREREEMRKLERRDRERVRALRSNNEERYIELLEETKNDRLLNLLNQTDSYLSEIGAMVQKLRKDAKREDAGSGAESDEGDDIPEEAGKGVRQLFARKNHYYTVTHAVHEVIKEQPSSLTGGSLKPYQIAGLQWMVSLYNNKLNGILADEMGLGKTIQTISLLAYLAEKKNDQGPYFIIVPLSTLSNWVREFDLWAPHFRKLVYKGDPPTRKQLISDFHSDRSYNVLLTTYEFVLRDQKALSRTKWSYIIIDEGHRMKNANSKLAMILGQNFRSKHRLLLTGTPLHNNLTELWGLLNFLLPSIFKSADSFEQWFNVPFQTAGERVELNEEEQLLIIHRLHQVLRPFLLRRLKKEVIGELPEKVEIVIHCPMSAWQEEIYRQIKEHGAVAMDPTAGKKLSKSLQNCIMHLRKACNHPYLFLEDYDVDENLVRVSGKFELLDRILPKLKATGHRVLLFCQMTSVMDIMDDYFDMRGIKYLRLDGHTKTEDRATMLTEFNAPGSEYFVFMLSTRAGGLGLNLQTADTVIIFDSDWNPQMDIQAQDRAHRIGQTKAVRVFRLVTVNSVEETILNQARFKEDMEKKIIQAGKFNTHSTDQDRRSILKELLSKTEDDVGDAQVPSKEELNDLLLRDEDELKSFQDLDAEYDGLRLERWRDEHGSSATLPPPLMEAAELPDWLKEQEMENKDTSIETEFFGRGMRARKDVVYCDGLTELQFTKLVDRGQDVREYVEERLEKAKRRRRKVSSTHDDDDDDDDSERPRKRRRRSAPKRYRSPDNSPYPQRRRSLRTTRQRFVVDTSESSEPSGSEDASSPARERRTTRAQTSTGRRILRTHVHRVSDDGDSSNSSDSSDGNGSDVSEENGLGTMNDGDDSGSDRDSNMNDGGSDEVAGGSDVIGDENDASEDSGIDAGNGDNDSCDHRSDGSGGGSNGGDSGSMGNEPMNGGNCEESDDSDKGSESISKSRSVRTEEDAARHKSSGTGSGTDRSRSEAKKSPGDASETLEKGSRSEGDDQSLFGRSESESSEVDEGSLKAKKRTKTDDDAS